MARDAGRRGCCPGDVGVGLAEKVEVNDEYRIYRSSPLATWVAWFFGLTSAIEARLVQRSTR